MKKKRKPVMASMIILIIMLTAFGQKQTLAKETPADYTSKVPKYSYANTPEEQEEQLESDPLLMRFSESSKQLAVDPYRQIYHYVNPEGNLNEPMVGEGYPDMEKPPFLLIEGKQAAELNNTVFIEMKSIWY
jgi:hypothetical protein